jgi:uncharacterized protein (TIGR00251 family)
LRSADMVQMDDGIGAAILPGKGGCVLLVEVQPGSSRAGKLSYDPWRRRLKVAVAERAREGRANAEVLEILASVLGVPESSLRIASGLTDRRKSVEVLGVGPAEALHRILAQAGGG